MYRYVVVPATGSASDEAVFETAVLAGRPFAAHLEFLHVRVDVTEVVISMSTGGLGSTGAVQGVVDKLEAEARQVEGHAWQLVEDFCDRNGIPRAAPLPGTGLSAEFTVETGSDAQWISEYGRFADLVVVGRPHPGREMAMEVLEAALMDTGRPLLIAPPTVPQTLLGTVVIAWKDTPEAIRAIAAALPLLERAEQVEIITVVEEDDPHEHAERLLRSLRWHNPNTSVRKLGRERRRPVDVLLQEAERVQASLIVMGAYSHSRLREVVFGGFTQRILTGIDTPVLMAHYFRSLGPDVMGKLPPLQLLWLVAIIAVVIFAIGAFGGRDAETLPYSQFQQLLNDGKVARVTVAGDTLRGELKEKLPNGASSFVTERVPQPIADELSRHGVEFSAAPGTGTLGQVLGWIVPPLLFVGLWIAATRFMGGGRGGMLGGGLLSVGRSRAKLVAETDVKTTFDDVAGVDEAKEELKEIVEFLKRPREFTRLGAHVPRGVLLVGPPGTGKTLLARAVAGEAGVPFFSTNGAEFVEMFVGVGAARVRDLFEQARTASPCIIFIDELDALGRARHAAPIAGQDEKEQTLNQMLAEMDGFDRSVAVVILAATNRPEILDPALLRAGRFDRQVLVDRPEKLGRIAILKVHTAKLTLAEDVDPAEIAAMTPGFTGADLANLANEAAVHATRRNADAIAMEDFTAAVERIVAGLEKRSRVLIPRERRTVAYHEMGHALVAMATPGADPVSKVSIIPRGIGALGYTMSRPTEDRFLMGRIELEAKLTVLMGGRAAEMLTGPDVSTGAADDLARATDIARGMVLRYGMDDELGPVAWDTEEGHFLDQPGAFWRPRRFSEETAREVDRAVQTTLQRALARALGILRANMAALEAGAERLLAHETLTADEIPVPVPTTTVQDQR